MKYNLATYSWDEKEKEAIRNIMDTDMYSMGEKVKQFENKFSEYVGSEYSVMVNSGSSANLLMIASLIYSEKLKRGDEVIVPSVSWSTTYFPLLQYGLKVKFLDIDINTLNINLVKEAITDKTKLIFVVNLLGNPNNFNKIKETIEGGGTLFL